jgi:hypothetical protein
MGIWSSIKKAVKKVVRVVKAAVRVAIRIPLTFFAHIIAMYDLLLGFLAWPAKNLTLHVVVLHKPADDAARKKLGAALQMSIDETRRILRDRFNVKLRPYGAQYIDRFEDPVPAEALNPSC